MPHAHQAPEVVLEARGLSKSFRGFTAVAGVDLRVRRGTIHSLIGPNGAGKSTLFNLLTRFLDASAGQVLYRGQDIARWSPARVARSGLVRSFQISAVFPQLSVRENVRIALQKRRGLVNQFWRSDRCLQTLDAEADALLERVGLQAQRHQRCGTLSYGRKRALELATTLALEPEVILLDEPMAGVGHEDIARIAALVQEAARGRTVVMVEHNLKVVAQLSDTITVLARGQVLAEGSYAEVSANPEVRAAYMGTSHG
jgi:branched-chain amino acid transport system ATP-binding protein